MISKSLPGFNCRPNSDQPIFDHFRPPDQNRKKRVFLNTDLRCAQYPLILAISINQSFQL